MVASRSGAGTTWVAAIRCPMETVRRRRATAVVSGSISTPSTPARISRAAFSGGRMVPPVAAGWLGTARGRIVPVVYQGHR